VTCLGTTDGYVSTVNNQLVTVTAGARVNGAPTTNVGIDFTTDGNLAVDGSIVSAAGPAVRLSDVGDYRLAIGSQGSITGTSGIAVPDDDDFRDVTIDNSGRIEGTSGSGILLGGGSVHIVNRANGVIRGTTGAIVVNSNTDSEVRIENAGRIEGDVITAFGSEDSFYQRIGGTVTGAIVLGGGDDSYWQEGRGNVVAGGVAGTIDGGTGDDIFGIRMTASGTVQFAAALPAGFERYGLDLCGCNTEVTIAAGDYAAPLTASGEGRIVSNANFTATGATPVLVVRSDDENDNDAAFGLVFVNRGTITGVGTNANQSLVESFDGAGGSTQFINEGVINLSGVFGYGIDASGGLFGPGGEAFVNRGTVNANAAEPGSFAVRAIGAMVNSGTIAATGVNARGVSVSNFGTLVNEAGGVIRATGVAVSLDPNATVRNGGLIESAQFEGVVLGRNGTVVNEAGGTIRGNGFSIYSPVIPGNPGSTIVNKGTLAGSVLLEGSGADTVWLAEGSVVQGNVNTGDGADRIIVDIGRVSSAGAVNTAGIVTGTLDSGAGNDELWLRAGTDTTANVVTAAAGYDGGLVYMAAGADTDLTLRGPLDSQGNPDTLQGRLSVSGSGTVTVDMNINNGGTATQSLRVIEAPRLGEAPAAGVNLIINRGINAGFASVNVDAAAARRVELARGAGDISFVGGTGLRTGVGTQVVLEAASRIRNIGSSTAFNATNLVAFGSDIINRGSIFEDADSQATAANISTGVVLTNGSLRNERNNDGIGRIDMIGTAVVASEAEIFNNGAIVSSRGDAIQAANTRIVNQAQGVISGHTEGTSLSGTAGAAITGSADAETRETVENAGTINGNVLLRSGNDAYVATGGTLNGSLDLGAGNDTLLTRGTAAVGITGAVQGGDGYDAIGRSFAATGTFDLATNVIPGGFEAHGVEALGAATEVTVSSATTQTAGMRLFGDGRVINTANVNFGTVAGALSAVEIETLGRGLSALTFENRATIESAVVGVYSDVEGLKSFTNSGTITAARSALLVNGTGNDAFVFRNTGAMRSTGNGQIAVDLRTDGADDSGVNLDFANGGQVTQAGQNGTALYLNSEFGLARIANTGTIAASGLRGEGAFISANRLALTNGGTIEATGAGGTALALVSTGFGSLVVNAADCTPGEDQVLFAVTNGGTIRANGGSAPASGATYIASAVAAHLTGENLTTRLVNAAGGVIEATGAGSSAVIVTAEGGGYGDADVEDALRRFELDNSGTIRGAADTVIAAGADVRSGGDTQIGQIGPSDAQRVIAGGIQTVNSTDRIRNLTGGQIIGNVDLGNGDDVFENFGTLTGDLRLGEGNDTFVFAAASTLTGTAFGGSGTDILLVDLAGTGSVNFDQFRGFETLRQRGAGTVTIRGTTDLDTLTIAGSNITVAAGTTFDAQGETVLLGSAEAETLVVSGTVGGSVDMGAGADRVTLNAGGRIEGNLQMGAGNDRVDLAGGTVTGTIDGGDGSDTIGFRITGDTSALPAVLNFESLDVDGNGRVTLAGQSFDTITLRGGADLTLNAGATPATIGNIVGDDTAQDVVINTRLTGGVSLGGGDDALSLVLAGVLSGALDGGAGTDTLNLNLTAASSITGGVNGFETINVAGSSPLTLGGTIAVGQALNFDGSANSLIIDGGSILGSADGGAGRDSLAFNSQAGQTNTVNLVTVRNFEDLVGNGAGTLAITGDGGYQTITINGGRLTIGENADVISGGTTFDGANNVLTLAANATLTGAIDGGAGTDRLVLNQAATQVRDLGSVNFTGFEQLESGGPGELRIDRNATFETVDLLGTRMTVVAGATLTVPTLAGGAAANTLDVRGTLAGNVNLGAGDDRLVVAALNSVTGTRSGGDGSDTLEFRTNGTAAAPVAWNGTGFDSFESLAVSQGVLSLTASTSWQGVNVSGGRLIGQAGTTITSASTIEVARGATFGSAGTVRGNINVAGTLSPGASPGTMTVVGNVAFQAGSNLLLEVAPTGSDLLNISGTLTVAQGAAIDITGALNSVPGGALDLVVAQGGINGGFTTINKSATVFGFVATRGNRIQIVGEFANSNAFGTNIQSSIEYANDVLGAGRKVQDFTRALPQLVTAATGASNPRAFAQLTAEAYGSAGELAIDNGLAVTDTVRGLRYAAPSRTGFYGFVQSVGQRNRLDGSAVTGASAARSNSRGFLGGLGYGAENGRMGVFVGTLDSSQSIAGLGASTDANGVVAGVFAEARLGGLGLNGLVAYDASEADTRRDLPTGDDARASYDLGGWIADFSADYTLSLGRLQVAPRLGLTYVAGRREGVTESGNPFALTVRGARANAWFGDAGMTFALDGTLAGQAFRPYLELGVRHQLSGRDALATGAFTDTPAVGPITVAGAERGGTAARLGAGFGLDLSSRVRLNVGYSGEFSDEARHNLTGGITIAF
jgi:hypothetical protein